MKFVDLQAEYLYFKDKIDKRWDRIKERGRFLFGPEVEELEQNFPKLIGVQNSVAVGNATQALSMILDYLKTYDERVDSDPVVILPNFGAYATAFACRQISDNLIYVDVDETMTMNVKQLDGYWGFKNGIIIAVHLFGNNCDMEAIMDFAELHNHTVIEDCAQSTGSGSGAVGDYSIFSFYPTKPLSSMGDGGMICSNNDLTYFKKARNYGVEYGYIGENSRMDEWQAAVVNAKMEENGFKGLNDIRKNIVRFEYKSDMISMKWKEGCVFHQFPIIVDDRDKTISILNKMEIPYMIHYPYHVNEIPILRGRHRSRVSYRLNDRILSLPIHPFLTDEEIHRVRDFLGRIT